jgi:quercetin dioxygenase-like cupin family protein/iron-sulfur cluster repair protein YtfE (RIC family)
MDERTVNQGTRADNSSSSWLDLIAHLRTQHRVAEAWFVALEAARVAGTAPESTAGSRASAQFDAVLRYVDDDLEAHIREEESLLFPRLRAAVPPWDQHLIDQVVAGHDQIRRKREELRTAVIGRVGIPSPAGQAAVAQTMLDLFQTLLTHVQNEEDLVLPLASQVRGTDTMATTGEMTPNEFRIEQAAVAPSRAASDLPAEVEHLHHQESWQRGDRSSKTLVDLPGLRVVLTAMQGGARLALHDTAARFTLQVLSGRLAVYVHEQSMELAAGHLLALDRNVPHDVGALVDSAFLLSLVWAGSEGTLQNSGGVH